MASTQETACSLLFPAQDTKDAAYFENKYPARNLPNTAFVTRLGPSPTGFVHLGNLFMATINSRLAKQSGGIFYLRVEDTDKKREVEGAIPALLDSLSYFGIEFDEGAFIENGESKGDYGPYVQSERREIYHAFAKKLLLEGKAYPCFLTEDEIAEIRAEQEAAKLLPGIYGKWAKWRSADPAEIEKRIKNGEAWTLRINADVINEGKSDEVTIKDAIRGEITFPRNPLDTVILKTDGLPTYHFAHAIDDHLMHTTHVIRGEEWLSSLPIHIMLADALGWEPPIYAHTALLMKIDEETGAKRKLSKRSDPELALTFYKKVGYHPKAMEEYLLTLLNSNYEEWRLANPAANNNNFEVRLDKMNSSGALVDLAKLEMVSRNTLLQIPAEEIAEFLIDWAEREKPDVAEILAKNIETLKKALDIGRIGEKPRKDLAYAEQILGFISYFFDDFFTKTTTEALPENVSPEDAAQILEDYAATYTHSDDRDTWFEKIRALAEKNGYAPKPKDFKANPEAWKGHIGDVSTVIRLAITKRKDSPDLYEIQQILGETRVRARITL